MHARDAQGKYPPESPGRHPDSDQVFRYPWPREVDRDVRVFQNI